MRGRLTGPFPKGATMTWRMMKAILLLPGNVLVVIPLLASWAARETSWAGVWPPTALRLLLALALAAPALALMVWTVRLFARKGGGGTPAPWDPIPKLVVEGPYRHVRNPMLIGVIVFLFAEALFFGSWAIAAWAAVFTAVNAAYFPLHEEPGLQKHHGEAYAEYKRNVRRWLPRATPWTPPFS